MRSSAAPPTPDKHKRLKRALEGLLRKHGYRRDDRPDHREWMKYAPAYHFKMRLEIFLNEPPALVDARKIARLLRLLDRLARKRRRDA